MQSNEMTETLFRWGRIQNNSDWLLPLIFFVLLLFYFIRRYRIDTVDLKRWQRSVLLAFRVVALCGILLYYFQPQWEHLVSSSRLVILVDTSASMGLRDQHDRTIGTIQNNNSQQPLQERSTRLDSALDWLRRCQLIEQFSEKHDVRCFSFSETLQEVGSHLADQKLSPYGKATALGESLFSIFQRERVQPLAGVVLITDGGQNTGQNLDIPLETAGRLRIPIYSIGVGQTHPPLNYRVGTINVPDRVVPSDPFVLKVPIEKVGGESSPLTALLVADELTVELSLDDTKIESKKLSFTTKGTVEVAFNVRIADVGKHRLSAEIIVLQEDHDPEDNRQYAEVDVVEKKDRILVFASAPTRDYQFICSQVFRDKTMNIDVFLPWAQSGITQNVDRILEKFPSTRNEMSEYDVVIAIDPNWRELSPEQINVLEYWTARQGGGLILIAGYIHQADSITGWVTDTLMDKVKTLYPVEFWGNQASFEHRFHHGAVPYPIKWSREGESAEFLQITDDQCAVSDLWSRFAGFYGYFSIRGVKPTATLLASTGNPEMLGKPESGALIAEQFYGVGRVLYFGSGELWRLRGAGEKAFEQIVTKIIRYVGQGRLQLESDRGMITTDKQRYPTGAMAQVRITANDPQLNPMTEPTLPIEILSPSGTLRMLDIPLDPNVLGLYQTYIPLDQEGTWSIQWTIPDTIQNTSEHNIIRTLQVQMSDLEREHPNRNVPLLREIAEKSGGNYFDTFESAEDLPKKIDIRSQRALVDESAKEKMLFYMLFTICSALLLEWTLRRLWRLV